jgi:carbamoyltransferase
MYILGLATMGEAAACLIRDGVIVAAAEEERFSRIKHHVGFPYQATRYVLSAANITIADVDHVGLYWKPWVVGRRILVALKSLGNSWHAFDTRIRRGVQQVSNHYLKMFILKQHLKRTFGRSQFCFHYLDHHVCHAASCFYVAPFDRAAILTVDGTGEDSTTLFGLGEGSHIRELRRIRLPHSLGQFYSAITNYLGFDMFQGDEWKVMGLAGWGEPEFAEYLRKEVLSSDEHGGFHLNSRRLDHHLAKRYCFDVTVHSPEAIFL